ncbi:helix-turn-helix-type transcriptional regulator [Amycolatopsis antarctica]|uniref:Helix-turn-helix-type transcriptional regulator n=1 Tax=Amycolatopsis antarctica TaxID=1854586 RepID=A0A263D3K1_9PSEU|nr:MerR family transcriptional regulator [Amycolatopsis antarctica]OZM72026.1 helix-turn-helix-type transcriptional regulator [Amycolatopsis antarctica]
MDGDRVRGPETGRFAAPAHTPGQVAEALGVSPVTLRSWDSRYGVGPTARVAGRHRRYSTADLRRLKLMLRLIEQGVPTREAADTAVHGAQDEYVPSELAAAADDLGTAAQHLHLGVMAELLDDCLARNGVAQTWHTVLAPVVRDLGERSEASGACVDAEWALAGAIGAAIDRHTRAAQLSLPKRAPVLLACCPTEQHSLPLRMMLGMLTERGVPAVLFGEIVPAATTLAATATVHPPLVVLWSMTTDTADLALVRRLRARGQTVSPIGPGWTHRPRPGETRVTDLDSAVEDVCTRLADCPTAQHRAPADH